MTQNQPVFTHRVTSSDFYSRFNAGAEIFPYCSFTKTVIAICALRMVEQGRVELDTCFEGREFSLRQLLNHISGLPDYQ